MSAQRASAPVRLAAIAAAVVLLAVAAAVVFRLAGRRAGPAAAPAGPPPEGRVDGRQERVRYQEYKDGRPVADVRGDRFFRGPDGRQHLTGAVEIASLGPAGETVARLTADEVAYDAGSLRFTVAGRVRVEAGGLVLEGDAFDYDRETEIFETASGGRFSSRSMTGRAGTVRYAAAADEVRLGGGFRAELAAGGPGGEGLNASGDALVYDRRGRRGRMDGRVIVETARFRAAAAGASFAAAADESGFESVRFEGAARADFRGGDGAAGGEMAAETIEIDLGPGSPAPRSVRASGGTALTVDRGRSGTISVRAPALTAAFDAGGRWTGWSASEGVRMESAAPQGAARTLEGGSADFDGGADTVRVAGGPGRPARADSAAARIEAAAIRLGPGPDELEAAGGVLCALKAGGGAVPAGLFSARNDVALSCDRLTFSGGAWTAASDGLVRAGQNDDVLTARELSLSENGAELRGRGGITAVLTEAEAGDAPGRRIEAGGGELVFRPNGRTLVLTGRAHVLLPPARLEAATVAFVLGPDGAGLESLAASTGVVVSKDRYEGRSEAASYSAATRRLSLTGRPVLTDGQGGSARGAKLTFDLADDKIFVENEGPERATTVIRS